MANPYDYGLTQGIQGFNTVIQNQRRDDIWQMEKRKEEFALKKQAEQEAAENRVVDMTTNPMFLSLSDAGKKKALDFFASQGFTDANGRGRLGDIVKGTALIEKTAPIFKDIMGGEVEAKKAPVIDAWGQYQDALAKGDPKAKELYAVFQKANMAYQSSAGKFSEHLTNIEKNRLTEEGLEKRLDMQDKIATARNETQLAKIEAANARAAASAGRGEGKAVDRGTKEFNDNMVKFQQELDKIDAAWYTSQTKKNPMTPEEYNRRVRNLKGIYGNIFEPYRKDGLWRGWEPNPQPVTQDNTEQSGGWEYVNGVLRRK